MLTSKNSIPHVLVSCNNNSEKNICPFWHIESKNGECVCGANYYITVTCEIAISIINHTLLSTIRAVISTLTCTSMASNSTSDSY